MGRDFELEWVAEVHASPEQVWDAIATGPGVDSWFMGRNEVDGTAGVVRTAFGGYTPESTVTAWEPGSRFAHRSEPAPDGRYIAYEFLIEGRAGGSTVLRTVTSGFLPGDDWEAEYDAMTKGSDMFFATLVTYLEHFPNRTATPVTAFGPMIGDWAHAWSVLHRAIGLTGPAVEGARVHLEPGGDGVVYFVNAHTLGIRTEGAIYRFLKGFGGPMIASHHLFAEVDADAVERTWQAWLTDTFPEA